MDEPKRGPAEGKKHAAYFGAEYQANRSTSSRQEYLDDVAWYYGYASFRAMPEKYRIEAEELFNSGVATEKKKQRK